MKARWILLVATTAALAGGTAGASDFCGSGYVKTVVFRNVKYEGNYPSISVTLDTTGFGGNNSASTKTITIGHDPGSIEKASEHWSMTLSVVQSALMSRIPLQINSDGSCTSAQAHQVNLMMCTSEQDCGGVSSAKAKPTS